MSKKIIFCFAGTGDPGHGNAESHENNLDFAEDVIRVYLVGCQHSQVGNGVVSPDLNIGAKNIRDAFINGVNGKVLDLVRLKENFTDGICRIEGADGIDLTEIKSITFEGFSRGAVSCFEGGTECDDLGIPINIIANQPVPGAESETATIVQDNLDLTKLKNINSATVILAAHEKKVDAEVGPPNLIHNVFFGQMVPKFSDQVIQEARVKNILVPYKSHLESFIQQDQLIMLRTKIELTNTCKCFFARK